MDKNIGYKSLIELVQQWASLKIEGVRLSVAYRMTILLSTLLLVAIAVILVALIMLFLSIAVAHILSSSMAMEWAYLIVAGGYAVLLVAVVALRRRLIMDAVARFMSRLLLDRPNLDDDEQIE